VTLAISSPEGIWSSNSGNIGASPTSLRVISTALISSVFSSIPRWILRHTRRLAPPCLRAFHSPSPSTLIPVLSAARQGIAQQCPRGDQQVQRTLGPPMRDVHRKGLLAPLGECTIHLPGSGRLSVLKSATSQSRPIRQSRLSTNPVVCRSAIPKRTFIVRQVWTAASL
jgi:hypothetical protein